MQTQQKKNYAEVVGAAIASYAKQITHAAQDSVAEQNDYCILDNCYKMQYLYDNFTKFNNATDFAAYCLQDAADTAVRECMYNMLHYYADTSA